MQTVKREEKERRRRSKVFQMNGASDIKN